jgi:cellulose synthase/poly-beta-1,6-N-acetylglucosamine synthase-like glycosyltransferase
VLLIGVATAVCLALALAGSTSSLAAAIVFWIAVALTGYTLVGYGLLVRAMATLRVRPVRKSPIHPFVSVVIVAHNEGAQIARKLENLLALDYPAARMEVIVASDGSTDDTVLRARAYEPRVRVHAFSVRRGKPAVLNEIIPRLRGTVVVLADTRQQFERGALAALVQNFADPVVGVVSGELMLVRSEEEIAAASSGQTLYWDQEKKIRYHEGLFDSVIGATGAIYAIRRDLFEPIPADTLLDDVLIPMRIARQGYRVIFEPSARAFDRPTSASHEFVRKVRTIAGNFQLFARESWLLNPVRNRLWLQTLSHKALRLALPVVFFAALVANVWLLDNWFYRVTLIGQLSALMVALLTWMMPAFRQRIPAVVLPYTICFLCLATIVGFLRYATGQQSVTWKRSPAALDLR